MRADSIFYGRDEVAEILGYKSAKAYKEVNKKAPPSGAKYQ